MAQSNQKDEIGAYGSITIARHAGEGRKALAAGDFATAENEYKIAVGLKPGVIDFYVGLYDAASHNRDWQQASFAISKILELKPDEKNHLAYEYGMALFGQQQFDQAITYLKLALANVDSDKQAGIQHLKDDMEQRMAQAEAQAAAQSDANSAASKALLADQQAKKAAADAAAAAAKAEAERNKMTYGKARLTFAKNYDNALLKSEAIVIATFDGYEKKDDIQFFNPPKAIFKLEKTLKGPKTIQGTLPIRFEFHDEETHDAPSGWSFTEDKMPEKSSKWILFLTRLIPVDGMLATYEGDYGRQPYTPDNFNHIMSLIQQHSHL